MGSFKSSDDINENENGPYRSMAIKNKQHTIQTSFSLQKKNENLSPVRYITTQSEKLNHLKQSSISSSKAKIRVNMSFSPSDFGVIVFFMSMRVILVERPISELDEYAIKLYTSSGNVYARPLKSLVKKDNLIASSDIICNK